MEAESFDLIVIGAGPAGVHGAFAAGLFGKRVALVERSVVIGGALVNTGTLPSKTLRETALTLAGVRARHLEVDVALRREATVADFMRHERKVAHSERTRLGELLQERRVELVAGSGRFIDPHTIEVRADGATRRLRAEAILIATGSSPLRPPEFPFDDPRVHDSDGILGIRRMPRRIAVVGAGVIGSEYACTFAALGIEVTVVDGRDVLLPFLDAELSRALCGAMEASGVRFLWKERVVSCETPRDGNVRLRLASGGTLEADTVLVAAGRKSNVESLDLAAAGLEAGERGLLRVDERFRTSVPHIYAAGDVIGFPALASTGIEQARVAVCDAFGIPLKRELSKVLPTGIYTIPEVSGVGATEEELIKRGEAYVVGRAPYAANPRGVIIGDRAGFLKLLFRRSDMKLLGVHVIGELATEVVHIGMMVMLCGGGAAELIDACFNVPTLGDLYKHAAYVAQITRDRPELLAER